MSRIARQGLAACFLALYVTVSHCGVGLHSVLEKTLAHHDHGPVQGTGATISGVSHDCLLCEFQAQSQIPLELPRQESHLLCVFHVAPPKARADALVQFAPCHPRAPPHACATLA
jgi:hypothetical protein